MLASLRTDLDAPAAPPADAGATDPDERLAPARIFRPRGHAAGDVIAGKYRLLGILGQGGMGTVWRARSLTLDIDVAVKVVRIDASRDSSERLLREARAAASLGHPAIVRIFDCGVTDADEPFLVMELLRGSSLADWLELRGRLSAELAVQVLLPIAAALAVAHGSGVIHRDIKPENILVTSGEGESHLPVLVDFGIAKRAGPRSGRVLTEAGMVLGSPEYMSPEQAQCLAEVDAQTDVWSFSVLLYELITGRRPFQSAQPIALIFAICRDPPRSTLELDAGDDALWAIIQRGLAKAPCDRWQGMKELGRALAEWAAARGIETDATGMSIARQWLGRGSSAPPNERRLLARAVAPRGSASLIRERASTEVAAAPAGRRGVGLAFAALTAALAVSALTFGINHAPPRPASFAPPIPAVIAAPLAATSAPLAAAPPAGIAPSSAPLPSVRAVIAPAPPRARRATTGSMPLPMTPNF